MTYDSIEIIFDRDHGRDNEGWYARTTQSDGTVEDNQISEKWAGDPNVAESTIRTWAVVYYSDPDGMTDNELQDLRDTIVIKRGFKPL
jgi:hypothetical protein